MDGSFGSQIGTMPAPRDFDAPGFLENVFNRDLYAASDTESLAVGLFDQLAKPWPLRAIRSADTHFSCALFENNGPVFRRNKEHWTGAIGVVLDDIGETKNGVLIKEPPVKPTAIIETKPGSCQWIYLFNGIERDREVVDTIQRSAIAGEMCDPGAGTITRITRLPGSLPEGKGHRARIVWADWTRRFDPRSIIEDVFQVPRVEAPKIPARPANMPPAPPAKAYGEVAMRGEVATLLAAPQGTRNAALNTAALKLGRLVPDGHLSESMIVERLTAAAAEIGLDAVETGATIKSGMTAGMASPRGPGGDALARLGAGPGDYIPAGMMHLPASGPTIIQSEPKRESQFYSAASLNGKAVPARQWLVDGLVPQKTVTLFSGDGGTGKSLLALQLAVAVSTERAWIGNPVSKGRVIYISAEDDDDELHRRVDDILRAEGCSYSALAGLTLRSLAGEDALLAVDSQLALMKTALFEELDARAAEDTPALIVIDTLADVYPANENDRAKVRQFVGILRGLALKHKCAVMLLAHPSLTGLNSGTGTSGSTAWNNSVRSRLYLSRISDNGYEADPDARVLTTMKANYGRIGGAINVRWHAGVFVAQAQPMGFEALAVGAKGERVFLQLLDQHVETGVRVSQSGGRNYAPKLFAEHPDNEGCNQRAFRTAMSSLFARKTITISEDGPPSKRRSFIMRAAQ